MMLLSPSRCLRCFSSAAQQRWVAPSLQVGQMVEGRWQVQKVSEVPSFSLTAIELEEVESGARYLHLARDDNNNAFCVGFRTPVSNNKGIPHILEHTILCGSEKYPIREPFFNMLRRSMQTYMNAWTGLDYTLFPFSTQNSVDFENLMRVYLDATLFPALKELDFMQEGHRLEFENLHDPTSPLRFKGVVFNEMKGAMRDPASLFYRRSMSALYPDSPYGFNSGGDPISIPDLTHQELLEFYHTYYNFSAAHFYSYGNFPLEHHLGVINSWVVDRLLDRGSLRTDIRKEDIDRMYLCPPYKPVQKRVHLTGPLDSLADPQRQTKAIRLYPMDHMINDPFTSMCLSFVSSLLLDGSTSPFHDALLKSGLGSDFAIGTGFQGNLRNPTFGIGLQGVRNEAVEQVFEKIDETLNTVCENGIPQHRVDALLHQVELSQKNLTTDFGLGIGARLLPRWLQGCNPVGQLAVDEHVARFKESMTAGRFVEDLVTQYLRVTVPQSLEVIMSADPEFSAKEEAAIEEKLQAKVQSLSPVDLQSIERISAELSARQDEKIDASMLPRLHLSDVDRNLPFSTGLTPQWVEASEKQVPLYLDPQVTNGLVYVQVAFPLQGESLQGEDRLLLPFIFQTLPHIGNLRGCAPELFDELELFTGGVSCSVSSISDRHDPSIVQEYLVVSGSALERNASKLSELMGKVLGEASFFSTPRVRSELEMTRSNLNDSVPDSGHLLACYWAASKLTRGGMVNELSRGISQVQFMNDLCTAFQADHEVVDSKLAHLFASLMCSVEKPKVLIVGEESFLPAAESLVRPFFENMGSFEAKLPALRTRMEMKGKEAKFSTNDLGAASDAPNTFFSSNLSVNYCAMCVPTVPYGHEDSPKYQILAQLLSSRYLHRVVREKGGAYGAGCSLFADGVLAFTSFRDPNTDKTLQAFLDSLQWVQQEEISDEMLEECKLEVFQKLDNPIPAYRRNVSFFLTGLTDEERLWRRKALFQVTAADLQAVAAQLSNTLPRTSRVAIFGSRENGVKYQGVEGWEVREL